MRGRAGLLVSLAVIVAVLAGTLGLSRPALAQAPTDISVNVEPPDLLADDQSPIPGDGYLWIPGYWAWSDDDQDFYWVPGAWVPVPQVGFLWTPGYWAADGDAFVWYAGYWSPHVGFYGGINYGYGFGGSGYEGAYWQGGGLFYNRAVNNVAGARLANVYVKPVAAPAAGNRTSFNGGARGTRAQPTASELAAWREPHLPATAQQLRADDHARSVSVRPSRPPAMRNPVGSPPPPAVRVPALPPPRQPPQPPKPQPKPVDKDEQEHHPA